MTDKKFVPVLQECLLNERQLNEYIDAFFHDNLLDGVKNEQERDELYTMKKRVYNRVREDLPNAVKDILKEFGEECEFELEIVPDDTK